MRKAVMTALSLLLISVISLWLAASGREPSQPEPVSIRTEENMPEETVSSTIGSGRTSESYSIDQEDTVSEQHQGFVVKELEGYIAVYYADGVTLYEETAIPLDKLTEHEQSMIRIGYTVESPEELYSVLETYSS